MTIPGISIVARNPEFRRNLWLEINTGRLVGMAVVILSIAMLAAMYQDGASTVMTAAVLLYSLIANVWGTKLAIDSVIDEVNGRTWTYQQMTPLSPWRMAWGKLFGSTIYAWYGGLICMLLMIVSGYSVSEHWAMSDVGPGMIFETISLHAMGMILALLLVRRLPVGAKVRPAGAYLIAVFGIWGFSTFSITNGMLGALYSGRHSVLVNTQMSYWGIEFPKQILEIFHSLFVCGWALVGLRQAMRVELQFENTLKIWYLFVATSILYVLGFIPIYEETESVLLFPFIAACIAVALTFLLIVLEPKLEVDYRRVATSYAQKNWKKMQAYLPLWAATLPIAIGLCIVASICIFVIPPDSSLMQWLDGFFPLSLVVFLLRDIAIILWVNLSKSKRPDATGLILLALLHVILPALIDGPRGSLDATSLLNPVPGDSALISFISGLVQASFAWAIVMYAWRDRTDTVESPQLA